ncbi:hypothetical protein DIURU_002463 [Diutina rugosa]|uniref:Zinc finger C2H2 LYAR-type domain-containing protein n=1 Tax=Diutina rugosa TaxID=5481 RepID=A0A642UUM9_DIURU|nr:uncharacterized protein DIURU_002463 [Diutina rugosa]KAA8903301.1 hypothetical protein DIURU_002463 [Diutina rugosa]
MVSFSCEACNETVIKKKCQQHAQRCYGAVFTCIDCYQSFPGQSFKDHTSCITEAQKVEGKLYKPKNKKQQQQPKKEQPKEKPKEESKKESKKDASKEESKKSKKESKSKKSKADDKLSSYVSSGDNLYKVMKKMAKADSKDIKEVLKKLTVTVGDDGKLVVSA